MATVEVMEYPAVETAPAQAPDQATPAPQTETRPPRLSEALRYGAINTKQAFGTYVTRKGAMCALSTIWHAMGYRPGVGLLGFAREHPEWAFLNEPIDTRPLLNGCCSEGMREGSLGGVVIHLNDKHRMPRDQIADRLSQFGL